MAIEKWVIEPGQTRTIDLELVRTLKASLIGGKVNVIAHDEPGARIEISRVTGKDLRVEIDGDRLEIDHPQLRWDNFIEVFRGFTGNAKADISILVPRDVTLKLGVVSAETLVAGFTADAKLNTVNGDLVVDSVTGDIDVNGVNAEISIANHHGRVRAHTISGDVSVSGEVSTFSSDSVSGNMILDLVGTPSKIDTNTVSGDLTARIDGGSGERYRVNTVSGTVYLDDTTITGTLGKGFERVNGVLEGDWLELNANSVSGDISVIKRVKTDDSSEPTTDGEVFA